MPSSDSLRAEFDHRLSVGFEMFDIADRSGFCLGPRRFQQLPQPRLALAQRQAAKVLPIGKQQIEGIEDQVAGLAVGNGRLQRGEIRRAMIVERDDLAVDEHIRKRAPLFRDRSELVRPVQALAGPQPGLAVLDAQLHAIAVEFDLVAPILSAWRPIDRRAEFGRDEIRHVGNFHCAGHLRGMRRRLHVLWPLLGDIAVVRMPHRVGPPAAGPRRHERLWGLAFAGGDLIHAAPGSDRSIGIQNVIGLALPGIFVAMLDQKPIGALAPLAIVAHAHQHPAAVQLVTVQREFQVALPKPLLGFVGFPIAAVPELHGAAAILALRNGAFEIAVIERMILHFDRQPLVMRIERGTLGDCPGFEDAVELEPQIVMQAGRGMLLDHETALF